MATSLRRIEKEFILGAVRDEKGKILLTAGSGEWPMSLVELRRDALLLSHAMPLRLIRRGQSYEFRFVYREQPMAFRAKVMEVKETSLLLELPESVYKNLGRRYSRRVPPQDFSVSFSFMGDRYQLDFPTSREFDPVSEPEPSPDFDPADIRILVQEFNTKAAEFASDRAILMWKERRPESLEERAVVRSGKVFYLPTAIGGVPAADPYLKPRILTRRDLLDFLAEEGLREDLAEAELERFERNKREEGVLSQLLLPVIFQEYVIGCVSLVNRMPGKAPFDLGVVDLFLQFGKVLAYSLKKNGYFKNAPRKKNDFEAKVVDLSAGGMLFANPSRELAAALLPDSRVELQLAFGSRVVKAPATLKRTYRDAELVYYALEYEEIAPEDFRFLFESLYGRPFTDDDAISLEGLVKVPFRMD